MNSTAHLANSIPSIPTPPLSCHTVLRHQWPQALCGKQEKCHHKESSSKFWTSVLSMVAVKGFPQQDCPGAALLVCSQKSGQWGGQQSTAELRLQRVCAGTWEMHQEGANTGLGILSCCCGNHINSSKCVVSWVRESVAACDTLCKINESCFMNDLSGHLKVKVSHAKDAEGAFLY